MIQVIKMLKRLFIKINENKRDRILSKEIALLKDEPFSIISSDCIGGILYHDLHKKFLSPTINLSIFDNTFITFCKYIDFFLSKEPHFVETKKPHPVAILEGPSKKENVKINFVHYKTKEDALKSWNKRIKRINLSNFYCIYNVDKIDSERVLIIDDLISKGYHFFVICRENVSGKDRNYIHKSAFLNKHPTKAGKLISFRFLSGRRNFDDLGIYNFIIKDLKQ